MSTDNRQYSLSASGLPIARVGDGPWDDNFPPSPPLPPPASDCPPYTAIDDHQIVTHSPDISSTSSTSSDDIKLLLDPRAGVAATNEAWYPFVKSQMQQHQHGGRRGGGGGGEESLRALQATADAVAAETGQTYCAGLWLNADTTSCLLWRRLHCPPPPSPARGGVTSGGLGEKEKGKKMMVVSGRNSSSSVPSWSWAAHDNNDDGGGSDGVGPTVVLHEPWAVKLAHVRMQAYVVGCGRIGMNASTTEGEGRKEALRVVGKVTPLSRDVVGHMARYVQGDLPASSNCACSPLDVGKEEGEEKETSRDDNASEKIGCTLGFIVIMPIMPVICLCGLVLGMCQTAGMDVARFKPDPLARKEKMRQNKKLKQPHAHADTSQAPSFERTMTPEWLTLELDTGETTVSGDAFLLPVEHRHDVLDGKRTYGLVLGLVGMDASDLQEGVAPSAIYQRLGRFSAATHDWQRDHKDCGEENNSSFWLV